MRRKFDWEKMFPLEFKNCTFWSIPLFSALFVVILFMWVQSTRRCFNQPLIPGAHTKNWSEYKKILKWNFGQTFSALPDLPSALCDITLPLFRIDSILVPFCAWYWAASNVGESLLENRMLGHLLFSFLSLLKLDNEYVPDSPDTILFRLWSTQYN